MIACLNLNRDVFWRRGACGCLSNKRNASCLLCCVLVDLIMKEYLNHLFFYTLLYVVLRMPSKSPRNFSFWEEAPSLSC